MNNDLWPWMTLALLGAWHGLNPAMGWLFGVALGLQKRSRLAVFASLAPIALGHAAAILLVVLLVTGLGWAVPFGWLRGLAAAMLIGFGLLRLWRNRHPKWVGMQVSFWDLTKWSALMASAHGAGLMLVPVLLGFRATFCQGGGLCTGQNVARSGVRTSRRESRPRVKLADDQIPSLSTPVGLASRAPDASPRSRWPFTGPIATPLGLAPGAAELFGQGAAGVAGRRQR